MLNDKSVAVFLALYQFVYHDRCVQSVAVTADGANLNTHISQRSVATSLRSGNMFSDLFIAAFLESNYVRKEFL